MVLIFENANEVENKNVVQRIRGSGGFIIRFQNMIKFVQMYT